MNGSKQKLRLQYRKVVTTAGLCAAEVEHCVFAEQCALVGSKLFVFGGACKTRGWLNTLLTLDITTMQWTTVETSFNPEERALHSMHLVGDKLYIFGGCAKTDMHSFDFTLAAFEKILQAYDKGASMASTERVGQITEFHEKSGSIIMFGGSLSSRVLGFAVSTNTWSFLNVKGQPPSARSGACSCIRGDRVFIYGGKSNLGAEGNDLFLLTLGPYPRWTFLSQITSEGSSRVHASISLLNSKLIVYGGEANDVVNMLLVYDLSSRQSIPLKEIQLEGPWQECTAHCAVEMGDQIMIIGGRKDARCAAPLLSEVSVISEV